MHQWERLYTRAIPVYCGAMMRPHLIAAALAIVSWDTVRQHREIDAQMGQE
jgi:hypothetical protein